MSAFWEQKHLPQTGGEGGDDGDLYWVVHANSRVGARVGHDRIEGRFEMGADGRLRHLAGKVRFGTGELTVGQSDTPMRLVNYSDQVFGIDLQMRGYGFPFPSRSGMLQWEMENLRIAAVAVRPHDAATGIGTKRYLPKIEFLRGWTGEGCFVDVYGGFQGYRIQTHGGDVDLTSWALGVGGGIQFDRFSFKATIGRYRNGAAAGWQGGGKAVCDSLHRGVQEADAWQAALVLEAWVSDRVSFETGFGFRQETSNAPKTGRDRRWTAYLQSVLKLAMGVYLVPEIGYFDDGTDVFGNDVGDRFYLGAKWQVDF